ncbi:MAG: MFS transporter [Aggregatilineales bacterium]
MSQRTTLFWFFASFIVLGISGTLLGPTLDSLTTRFGMPLENGGIFITLHSTGATISLFAIGKLFESGRWQPRFVLSIGPVLLGVGALLMATTQIQIIALAGALIYGLGFGSVLTGPTVFIAAINPGQSAGKLNALNMFYGVGAIIGPQIVNAAFSLDNFLLAYFFTGTAALVFIIPFLQVDAPASQVARATRKDDAAHVPVNWWLFAPFGLLLFIYVGAEVGFGAWLSTQMMEGVGSTERVATIAVSLFWLGLTGGRGCAIVLSRSLRPAHILLISVSIITGGAALLLYATFSEGLALLSAFAVGVGCGPMFPTILATVNDNYPEQFVSVSGTLLAIGNAGAVLFPWIQGKVGAGNDGGIIVTFTLGVLMIAIMVAILRQLNQTTRPAPA